MATDGPASKVDVASATTPPAKNSVIPQVDRLLPSTAFLAGDALEAASGLFSGLEVACVVLPQRLSLVGRMVRQAAELRQEEFEESDQTFRVEGAGSAHLPLEIAVLSM